LLSLAARLHIKAKKKDENYEEGRGFIPSNGEKKKKQWLLRKANGQEEEAWVKRSSPNAKENSTAIMPCKRKNRSSPSAPNRKQAENKVQPSGCFREKRPRNGVFQEGKKEAPPARGTKKGTCCPQRN